MFWSIVLPIQVAFFSSLVVLIVAFGVARHYGKCRLAAAVLGVHVAGMAFVPLCVLASYAASPFRFGRFEADNAQAVRFDRVRVYLPPDATDLEMITTSHDHHVRFRISEHQLVGWMNHLWKTAGPHSPMPRTEAAFGKKSKGNDNPEFVALGMDPDAEYQRFEGPYQSDWGGPTLWYDPATQTAWQRVGYW